MLCRIYKKEEGSNGKLSKAEEEEAFKDNAEDDIQPINVEEREAGEDLN